MTTGVGTPYFRAPETVGHVRMGDGAHYGAASDVYSLALLMWCVWSCEIVPFPGFVDSVALARAIERGQRPVIDDSDFSDCPAIVELMKRMWAGEPRARPTAREVLADVEALARTTLGLEAVAPVASVARGGVTSPTTPHGGDNLASSPAVRGSSVFGRFSFMSDTGRPSFAPSALDRRV